MKIELIHLRHSDTACEVEVFIDGKPADFREVSIDAGAGWLRSEWNELPDEWGDLSPAARALADEWFKAASDSPYIED